MKIAFLLSRVPYPLEKGDKLRAFQQIKGLSKNHEIHLICLNDSKLHPKSKTILSKYCKSITILNLSFFDRVKNLLSGYFSKMPLQVAYFYCKRLRPEIEKKLIELNPDLVFCQLIRMAEYAKHIKSSPKIIDFQDAFSKGAEQRKHGTNLIMRLIYNYEHNRLSAYETKVFDYFDEWLIISEQDKKYISHPQNDKIKIIPNGIDTGIYHPNQVSKKYDLLFVGNLQYPPNIDSVKFLVKQILPKVIMVMPEIKVLIAGANPGRSLLKLKSKNVKFSGWVDDISECYANSKVFVAPMRIGTGLQNKLLEAMAMKLPCITTSLVNNALLAKPNTELIVNDEAKDIASYIVELLSNAERAKTIANNGYDFALKNFDLSIVLNELDEVLMATRKDVVKT